MHSPMAAAAAITQVLFEMLRSKGMVKFCLGRGLPRFFGKMSNRKPTVSLTSMFDQEVYFYQWSKY